MRSGFSNPPSARVAVLIPTYNRSHLLSRAIESVLGQTFDDLTLTICDNASTDDTAEVVQRFGDPRLRYIRHEENLGVLRNFQYCLSHADAEMIKLMTDDDVLHPTSIERAVRVLDQNPHVGLVHTGFDCVNGSGEPIMRDHNWTRGLSSDAGESGRRFIRQCMRWSSRVSLPSAVFRAAAVPSGGFVLEDGAALDLGLWLRIGRTSNVAFLAAPSVTMCFRADGVSAVELGAFFGDGYRATRRNADNSLKVKLRFLEETGGGSADPRLVRLARRRRREELISSARDAGLAAGRPSVGMRELAIIVRDDPLALTHPVVYKDVALNLLGSRVASKLRRWRRRRHSRSLEARTDR